MDTPMQFLIISGRSGSGKSSALHLLEDEGFTCIDNIPVDLLPALIKHLSQHKSEEQLRCAIGIDARNIGSRFAQLPEIFSAKDLPKIGYKIIYLDTSREVLLKRFSETRRKHPLSNVNTGLNEAIAKEKAILAPVAALADATIDTTHLNLHELRSTIKRLIVGAESKGVAIMLQSFGFKFGVPVDCDFIFDVRCLPNPYWSPELRSKSGMEAAVITFLNKQEPVKEMFNDILSFIIKWAPSFEENNRSYLTVGVGCTGGMHRSVYLCEKLSKHLAQYYDNVQSRHRQLLQKPGD